MIDTVDDLLDVSGQTPVGELLADLHALTRRVPDGPEPDDGSRRYESRYPWAEAEAAMMLRWTYSRAAGQMALAMS